MYHFAISPTRDINVKDLRVALLNYICSKQDNEKFIIQIEDINKGQNLDGKDKEILEILNLFGIRYDQISYQSENLKFYRQLASKLLMDGHAFSCFCKAEILKEKEENSKQEKTAYRYDGTCKRLSDAEVMANENPFVVRIKRPNRSIEFTDIIKGKIKFEPGDIDDFVILKVDKTPTKNFASAIDEMLYNINMIIKDEQYISDTPKQELIRKYLGYDEKIEYAHIPSISVVNDDPIDIRYLLEDGFLPSSIINYLISIGNKTPQEIFTLDEAIEWFDLKDISNVEKKFEIDKLKELNKKHISMLHPLELSKLIGYSSYDLGELAKIYLKELSTINEIKAKIDTIFSTKYTKEFSREFGLLKDISKDMPYFKEFDEFEAYLSERSGLKDENLLKPLRILLTGEDSGPDLSDIYPYIKNYLGEIIK